MGSDNICVHALSPAQPFNESMVCPECIVEPFTICSGYGDHSRDNLVSPPALYCAYVDGICCHLGGCYHPVGHTYVYLSDMQNTFFCGGLGDAWGDAVCPSGYIWDPLADPMIVLAETGNVTNGCIPTTPASEFPYRVIPLGILVITSLLGYVFSIKHRRD